MKQQVGMLLGLKALPGMEALPPRWLTPTPGPLVLVVGRRLGTSCGPLQRVWHLDPLEQVILEEGRERARTREQGSHRFIYFFNDQDLEIIHFHIYHILLVRSESLSRAHIQGKGIIL